VIKVRQVLGLLLPVINHIWVMKGFFLVLKYYGVQLVKFGFAKVQFVASLAKSEQSST